MPRRDLVPEFWADLARLLPASAVVLDLGAHLLEEASQLLPLLPQATWHALEPNPECCLIARSLVMPSLPKSARVHLHEVAVGRENGTALLRRSRMKSGQPWTASSSTRVPKQVLLSYPWMEFDDGIVVPQVALDAFCAEHGVTDVDLVKMDVQGAEVDAIAGGQLTFARARRVLTEVCESQEYEGQLGLAGILEVLPGDWVVEERLLCDALLVRKP
jgi:FkbM family methyltransferase